MKRVFLLSAIIVAANTFLCAQTSNSTTIEGRWAVGSANAFIVEDHVVYSANGGILLIIDLSTPSKPRLLGQISTNGIINDIAKSGNYIYLAEKNSGLVIIDVSNLSDPVIAYEFLLPGPVNKLLTSNNTLYIIEGQHFNGSEWLEGGLRILDISTPINPKMLGFYDSPKESHYISLVGNYVYIDNYFVETLIIDVSDLDNPVLVDSINTRFGNSYLKDNILFVASDGSNLNMFDVTNPTSPLLLKSNTILGGTTDITASGNNVYITTRNYWDGVNWDGSKVSIFNIADPTNPTEVGDFDAVGNPLYISILGNTLIVNEIPSSENFLGTENRNGLRFLNISNPASPQTVAFYDIPNQPLDVTVRDNYAFALTLYGGISIVDVQNISNPMQIGYYNSPGNPQQLVLKENYAYLADGYGGLRIINISDLANPVEVGSYGQDNFYKINVSDNYAFVLYYNDNNSSYTDGMYILDISDPSNIRKASDVSFNNIGFNPLSVLASGNYVYLGDAFESHQGGSGHIRIYDISDITNPVQVGEYYPGYIQWDFIFYPTELALKGNNLFVANRRGSLDILDVSDPTTPVIASNTSTFAEHIVIDGNYAYLSQNNGGIKIFDISDSYNPLEIDNYNPDFYVQNIDVKQGKIYVSASDFGMVILQNEFTTDVEKNGIIEPTEFILDQNYPNPFNPETKISYTLPSDGFVSLKIYDILGNEISTLLNTRQTSGLHEISFSGTNLSSGVYLYILKYEDKVLSKKMLLLK